MSSTWMYAAMEDGTLRECANFRNSYGSAPMIWGALVKRYVPEAQFEHEGWALTWEREDRMEPFEVEALRTTYDRMVLRREHMLRAAESLVAFADRYQRKGYVCSLREQADEIQRQHTRGAIAIAWNQTDCGQPWTTQHQHTGEDCDLCADGYEYNVIERSDHVTWRPAGCLNGRAGSGTEVAP